jgi:hypothetical protein
MHQSGGEIYAIAYSDSLSLYATGGGGNYEINVRNADNDKLI